MKKYLSLILVFVLAGAMMLTACGKSEFGASEPSEKAVTIKAENAGADAFFTTGTLVVEDGEKLLISSALEKGSVQIDFIQTDAGDIDSIPDGEGDAALTVDAEGTEEQSRSIAAGSYMISATVTEKATGTIQITVEKAEPEQWKEAASTDEAADAAGVGMFVCDPQGTSLGSVTDASYRYMEGVAEAHYGIAAVEVFVRKGLASINNGDISFDNNDYAYEWTHDHDGLEVKCFGNREGEATKSIWTVNDYSYCILAYGAGGDDDYGLSAEDLDTMMNDIQ